MKDLGPLYAIVISVLATFGSTARADQRQDHPMAIDYLASDNDLTLYVSGARLADVVELRIGQDTLAADRLSLLADQHNETLVLRLGDILPSDGTALWVDLLLADGAVISANVTSPVSVAAATCDITPKSSRKCGGTTLSFTPNYGCCDANSDGDMTDTGVGGDGNCTWYAAAKAKLEWGWSVPAGWGNATWCSSSHTGWTISDTPKPGASIACISNPATGMKHVAWLERVSSDGKTIYVTEQNCPVPPTCFSSGTRTKSYSLSTYRVKYVYCKTSTGCR